MAQIVPSTLSPTAKKFWETRIRQYNMDSHVSLRKHPLMPPGKAESLSAGPDGIRKKSQYLDEAMRDYVAQLKPPISPGMNAIGWYRGEPLFIILRNQIGPEIRERAMLEMGNAPFTPCNSTSGRYELKGASRYNQHKTWAGEWNPGYRVKHRFGVIEIAKQGDLANYPDVRKLVRVMGGIWQKFYPQKFRHAVTLCPDAMRLAGTPFSRLAVLKSAASAVHVDSQNGLGVACMTTIQGPGKPYEGGVFCFVEFGIQIAVKPGDVLIANTPAHWHCNIGKITGVKYSVVAYFTKMLGTSQVMNDKFREATGAKYDMRADRDARFAKRSKSFRAGYEKKFGKDALAALLKRKVR